MMPRREMANAIRFMKYLVLFCGQLLRAHTVLTAWAEGVFHNWKCSGKDDFRRRRHGWALEVMEQKGEQLFCLVKIGTKQIKCKLFLLIDKIFLKYRF